MPREILIVDDSVMNRLMLKNVLYRDYDVIEAEDGIQALEMINRERETLSAVLLDIVMPKMDGYEVLRSVRGDPALSQIPIIMVTGSEDEQSRVKALSYGANDFILKPFNPDIVRHCLKNNITMRETVSTLNAIQKDKLTGVYNREAFFETASQMIAAHEPNYYLLSCFDIDNFKLINDQYGTAEGDRILKEIGRTVSEDMELVGGIAGRISADNFAVLLPLKDKDLSITRIVKQNRMAFSDKQAVVFSVGRYIISDISLPVSAIYDRAYIAKRSVKGKYAEHIAYFDDKMLNKLVSDQQIVDNVDAAIAQRQFEVWFQPQRNHSTGALVGAEALVRWRHPEKGLMPPGDFIPIFEKNGFVYELDKYVWDETCRYIRRWLDEGVSPVPISVNVSRYDVFRPDFIDVITGIVRKYGVSVEMLRLEITESAFANSTKEIVAVVQKLIDKGFVIEIDDFGSGYSSLNTLKSVPAQILKLDMRFLEDGEGSERTGNILESVVRMAKWMGMAVIAEGVEDKRQADYLTSIGCSYIQGYYYARPMPASDYEEYCRGIDKEERLLSMDTVDTLDNSSFWNPKSMDTLIFNSYVGAACIFEYYDRKVELLRVNRKFAAILGNGNISVEDTLKLNWLTCLSPESLELVRDVLRKSYETREEYTKEYLLLNIPGAAPRTYLRATMRVIATSGRRMLVYCASENITAQREAERLEKNVARQLQSMMRDMPGGFVRMRVSGGDALKPIYFNEGFSRLTGMNGGELKKLYRESVLAGVFPEDIAAVKKAVADMLKDGKAHSSRYRLRHKNGGYIWLSTFGSVTTDADGKRFLDMYFTDATDEVREEETLKQLLDNLPCGAALYDYDGKRLSIAHSNKRYWQLVGRAQNNDREKNIFDFIHPDDKAVVENELASAISENRDAVADIRIRHGAKGYRPFHVTGSVIAQADGRYMINAVFFDVTEQRAASERLRMTQEVNRLAILQSKDMVYQYEVVKRRLIVPENINPIFGMARVEEDVPYKTVRDGKLSSDTAKSYIDFYESIMRGDKSGEARFQRSSSIGWRWLEAHFTTIFSDTAQPEIAVISVLDVTESIEKDAAYKKWRQSLRDKPPMSYTLYKCNITKDIVLDSEQGSLISEAYHRDGSCMSEGTTAYAKACVFSEDRERFSSFIEREAQLLRYERGRRTDSLEYREKLPAGGVRWLKLTIDFMDSPYSADVEGYLLYEDIDEVKKEELLTQRRAQTDSLTGLYNRNTFAEKLDAMLADRKRGMLYALFIIDLDGFKQVNDSFGHAVGDETLIEIGQKLKSTFRERDIVCRLGGDEFMVCMAGASNIGTIKEKAALVCALLHKSFSIEVQLSASVGVAVCPEHGENFETLYKKADIALYHVKEMGKDNYAIYAQAMSAKEHISQVSPAESAQSDDAKYVSPKRRMLIVEDNEINRDYLTNLFEDDFIIDTAAEGTAALIRLRRYAAGISVVLLDLMMPGLGGFAVLKKMRESLAMQNIPVIVVSGMNERETCLKAIKEGASDYITKPVDPDLLKLRVASVISRAENEQLRAQNRYLAIQNEEAKRLAEARKHSEELSVALHAAERADLAKSQFLSSMSHEIRTPLNAVIGYNTIAKSELGEAKTDEERRQAEMRVMDCLTKSEVASRHLLTIINDVLDMSAIESGKMKVDETPFDFRSLITSLTVMFFSQARSKGVNFEVLFDKPTEEWFVGDQMRINQILTNLLSNAVKFTSEGGNVKLAITETPVDDKTTDFSFVVSDTGIGMTQEYLSHIWTPFEQAEASISRRFGGTGLGLSITKNLVDLMKGTISVRSESGVGSSFTVKLTLKRTRQPDKHDGYDFSDINALVVDDDASTCDYIKLLFDRCGARCSAFTQGQRAIEAFELSKKNNEPYNVCLVDWRMPHMDGFETISQIRRISGKDLPIVVVTAYDFGEVSDKAEQLGINRFISKPLFQSSLFDLLATVSAKQPDLAVQKEPKFDFDGTRILLVEDNNMNMEVAKRILLSAKFAVDGAWNGQEAVDIFAAAKPGTYKAILMDVHMPQMDGYQATRMIRALDHPDAETIPIIAMTADVFAEDIAQAHNAGMNDHIAKPIDMDSLFKMLSKYMEGGK